MINPKNILSIRVTIIVSILASLTYISQAGIDSTKTIHLNEEAIPVEIIEESGKYTLYRGGQEYFIKGAGGQVYLDRVKEYGGNSIRLWSTRDSQESGKTVQEILDEAHSYGLTVTLGLWVTHPRHDQDFYGDPEKVNAQLEGFREDVLKYKDHPALLMWAVGNEVHLNTDDTRVWDAVGDIAEMIKLEDSLHPVTTITANINSTIVNNIKNKAPEIDLLGVNAYGNDLLTIPEKIRNSGWYKAWFMGEFGPVNHWQVSGTPWGAKFEPLNTQKADTYKAAYEVLRNDTAFCVGSYVFKWGWKWQRTYSWINLFTKEGLETEAVDVMHYMWRGSWPENRAPQAEKILLNGEIPGNADTLSPSGIYSASVNTYDPDNDKLIYDWVLYEEGRSSASGGDAETEPPKYEDFILEHYDDSIVFQLPDMAGPFRLYVFVKDTAQNVGISNFPFYIRQKEFNIEGDSLLPVADTYARGGSYSDNNYGDQTEMITKVTDNPGFTRESFLKFDISSIHTKVSEAHIDIYGKIVNGTDIEIYSSANSSWKEGELNWDNRPEASELLDRIIINDNSEGYFTWDVSDHLVKERNKANRHITFIIKAAEITEKEIPWNTKEAGINPPILSFVRSDSLSELKIHKDTLEINKGGNAVITKTILNATGNYPSALSYILIEEPSYGELFRGQQILAQGDTFTQSDIDQGQLSYSHLSEGVENDQFIFSLEDPTGAFLNSQVLNININESTGFEPDSNSTIKLYPNPARDILHLEYNMVNRPVKVELLSSTGKVLKDFTLYGEITLSIEDLESGLYFIRLKKDSEIIIQKFIKMNTL